MRNNNNNNERSGGSSSSSSGRKGKNKSGSNNSSEKPKQPQRGLGVAQLEKIRLHSQMATYGYVPQNLNPFSPSPPLPPPPPGFHQPLQGDLRFQAGYQAALQASAAAAAASSLGYPPPAIGSSSSYACNPNYMVGRADQMERTNAIRYTESQPCTAPRWNPNSNVATVLESQHYAQPPSMVTRHLLSHVEQNSTRPTISEQAIGAGSQNSMQCEQEELDLELKL